MEKIIRLTIWLTYLYIKICDKIWSTWFTKIFCFIQRKNLKNWRFLIFLGYLLSSSLFDTNIQPTFASMSVRLNFKGDGIRVIMSWLPWSCSHTPLHLESLCCISAGTATPGNLHWDSFRYCLYVALWYKYATFLRRESGFQTIPRLFERFRWTTGQQISSNSPRSGAE